MDQKPVNIFNIKKKSVVKRNKFYDSKLTSVPIGKQVKDSFQINRKMIVKAGI